MSDLNNLNYIDEFLKYLGYEKDEESFKVGNNNEIDNPCVNFDSDTPNGFQDVNPFFFLVIGEIIGDVISGNLPFNTANSVSNILNLVGQILETYSAQISYLESGPGNCYNPNNRNLTNPFCNTSKNVNEEYKEEVELLQNEVNILKEKLNLLQERIDDIENLDDKKI